MQSFGIIVVVAIACIQASPTRQVTDNAWGEPRG